MTMPAPAVSMPVVKDVSLVLAHVPSLVRLGSKPLRNFGAARGQRLAQKRRGVAGELSARLARREPLGDFAAVDDRSPVLDVEEAHASRSAARRFRR